MGKYRLVLALIVLSFTALSAEAPRQALVIGNGKYAKDAALKNPTNDAKAVSDALRALGWEVTTLINADRRAMMKSAATFRDKLSQVRGSTALFFYAGHGMQLSGENYLIPVGSVIESEDDIRSEAFPMAEIQMAVEDSGASTSVVILDACRDNPFAKKGTRSGAKTRGLSVVAAPITGGTAVIFATSPNDVAQDGEGLNGVFTEALLKYLPQESLKIEDVMKRVRQEVMVKTQGKQQPWSSFSMSDDFYFSAKPKTASLQQETVTKPAVAKAETSASASNSQGAGNQDSASFQTAYVLPSTLWLNVNGPADGIEVIVNGKKLGETPLTVKVDRVEQKLELKHPDWKPYAVSLKPDKEVHISIQPQMEHSTAFVLRDLQGRKLAAENRIVSGRRQRKASIGIAWGSLAVFGVGGLTSIIAGADASSLTKKREAAVDPAEYESLDDRLAAANAAYRFGSSLSIVGGSVGILSLALSPNVKTMEKNILSLDEQIEALKDKQ